MDVLKLRFGMLLPATLAATTSWPINKIIVERATRSPAYFGRPSIFSSSCKLTSGKRTSEIALRLLAMFTSSPQVEGLGRESSILTPLSYFWLAETTKGGMGLKPYYSPILLPFDVFYIFVSARCTMT